MTENYPIVTTWIMLFFVIWVQVVPQTDSIIEATLSVFVFLGVSFPFVKYLSGELLQRAMKRKKATIFILQFFLFSFITGGIFVAHFYLFSLLEDKGVFPQSEYFDMNIPLPMTLIPISSGFFLNACICGICFFQENTKLKKVLIEHQLQTLKHQVTPHFMFNVLNHVNILIRKEPELASSVLINYTNILRYQLYNGEKETVSIVQEIKFLKDFIEVEKIRWKNSLDVKYSWDIEDHDTTIAPLMLITFVENAFKHVSRSKVEKGYIYIDLKQRNEELSFLVENSKYADIPTYKNDEESGIGLKNIRKRLDILYQDKYCLDINSTETSYSTSLSIKL